MTSLRLGLLCLALLCAPARADTAADIAALKRLFVGTYDNALQVAANPGVTRFTTYIRPVAAPVFGEHLLYVEEIRNGDANDIARIRLYKFTPEGDDGTIRLHLINPTDVAALKGAHADLARAERLTPADVRPDRGLCDVFIRRTSPDRFEGRMKPKSCDLKDAEGRALYVDYELVLDAQGAKVRHRRLTQDGDAVVWEQTPGVWLEQARVGD
ncbi:MAG: chromophore lyase CpcT/CpeT [Rhodospirillaceae bacterium]|nr:chromophore lyase CpcT/CpeT [Rhodospirillaceae bacterium]